jgi:hypothetical protein
VVKVILVLHVTFFPFVFQILHHDKHVAKCGRIWIACNSLFPCVWGSSSLLAFVTSVVLQILLIIIKPWFQSFVMTDFHPVLVAASSSTVFLLLPEQNMCWNITPSWSSWNYVSNEPSFAWNGFRTRELCLFYSSDAICNFQNVQCLMFLPHLLVQVFKIDDPWCVGKMFEGASEYELLFHCTSLNTFSNLDGNNSFPLKPCRWLTILIAIGQELMGTLGHACETNQMHILPPGW